MATLLVRQVCRALGNPSNKYVLQRCSNNIQEILVRRSRSKIAAASEINTEASKANWQARLELATVYRALSSQGFNEGVCNHLTLTSPAASGDGEVMLIIPYGLDWSEVSPSNLIGVNDSNEVVEGEGFAELSAVCIHSGVRRLNPSPNKKCVLHTHMNYTTSLGCLQDPTLRIIHQGGMRFYDRIAYDKDYDGYALAMDEGKRLAKQIGDKDILMLCNHGVLVCGSSAALAYDRLYFLERAALFQILAMSTGQKLNDIPEEMIKRSVADLYPEGEEERFAKIHFASVIRKAMRDDPSFAN